MIDTFRQLAADHAWVIAPVGKLDSPLQSDIGILDYMLGDPVADAIDKDFFQSAPGEVLLVAPGESPLSGILLVGYGTELLTWEAAMTYVVGILADVLPQHAESIAILPPQPTINKIPVSWKQASERFVPGLRAALPKVKRLTWIQLAESRAVAS